MKEVTFNEVSEADIPTLQHIYNYYVTDTTVTFSTEVVTLEEMNDMMFFSKSRFRSYGIWLEGGCVGYVLLQPFKTRQAYDYTAEIAIYLRNDMTGLGLGRNALLFIEAVAKELQFHTILASVCAENVGSLGLFRNHGYTESAFLKEVGYKFDRLLDVIILQKIL